MLSVTPSKRPLFDPFLDHFLTMFDMWSIENPPNSSFSPNSSTSTSFSKYMCDDDLRQSRFACGTSRFDTRTGEFYLKMPFLRKIQSIHEYIHHLWIPVCQSIHIMNNQPPRVFISWIICVQSIHTHIILFMNRPELCPLERDLRPF